MHTPTPREAALERLRQNAEDMARVRRNRAQDIAQARSAGVYWADIAQTLDVSEKTCQRIHAGAEEGAA